MSSNRVDNLNIKYLFQRGCNRLSSNEYSIVGFASIQEASISIIKME